MSSKLLQGKVIALVKQEDCREHGCLRLLIAEDCEDDGFLMCRYLEEDGFHVDARQVADAASFSAALAESWDLILCDYRMGDFDGLEALALYKQAGLDLPFIIVSEHVGEETAIALMREGVHDFVHKAHLGKLAAVVSRELKAAHERFQRRESEKALLQANQQLERMVDERTSELVRLNEALMIDIAERKQTEKALKESQVRLLEVQRIAGMGHWQWDIPEDTIYSSDQTLEILGLPPESANYSYEFFLDMLPPEERPVVEQAVAQRFAGAPGHCEYRIIRPDGEMRYVESQAEVVFDETGQPLRMAGSLMDVTERKQAELAVEAAAQFNRAVLDALTKQIGILDEQGKVIATNKAWREFGKDSEKQRPRLGDDYFEACQMVDPEIRKSILFAIRAMLKDEKEHFSLEYSWEIENEMLWFRLNGTKFQVDGKTRIVLAHTDITEQKRSWEKFELLSSQYEALLNNIPDFTWMKDLEGRYIAINEPAMNTLGAASREDVLGRTDADFWPEAVARKIQGDDRFVARTGKRIVVEEYLDMPGGQNVWLEVVKSPIFNSEGQVIGTAGIGRDITNRKEAEALILRSHEDLEKKVAERTAELQAANQTLKETESLRRTFVSSLTHDLRTPLIAQRRLIDLLQDLYSQNPKSAFLCQGLVENNENLLDMVAKLLETYQYEEGKMILAPEPVQLKTLVHDCMVSLHQMAVAKDIRLINRVPEAFPMLVDASLLKRVFTNLIGNAIENITEGCSIEMTARTAGETAIIEVRDDGPGIDPEALSNLFDRYFTRSRTRQRIGAGLGLFICKAIVELHGGDISVASQPGEGAVFTIRIPAVVAAGSPEMAGSQGSERGQA